MTAKGPGVRTKAAEIDVRAQVVELDQSRRTATQVNPHYLSPKINHLQNTRA
jgi:hypothetical protein